MRLVSRLALRLVPYRFAVCSTFRLSYRSCVSSCVSLFPVCPWAMAFDMGAVSPCSPLVLSCRVAIPFRFSIFRLALRLARASRLMRLGRASRTIYPGHQQGVSDERSKQTNKKTGTGKRDEKTGSRTGREQNEHNKTTGMERGRNKNDKQAGRRQRGHTTQSRTRTTPIIILARPPLLGSCLFAGLI